MKKRHIILWKRIVLMLFAATLCITGVWFNTVLITFWGLILWGISTAINVIYSVKDYDLLTENSSLEKVDSKAKFTVIKGNKGEKEFKI